LTRQRDEAEIVIHTYKVRYIFRWSRGFYKDFCD